MSNVTHVKDEELTALANGLKAKGENILNAYKNECSQAIQLSSECLQVSGLSSANFLEALEKIYSQVNNRLASFADFLTRVVVQEYAAVSEAIVKNFNSDFANEISGLLGISVSSVQTPVTAFQPSIIKNTEGESNTNISQMSINSPGKTGVIELDSREKEGFNKATQTISGVGGNGPSTQTPTNQSGGRGHAANDPVKAVQHDGGISVKPQPTIQNPVPKTEPPKAPIVQESSKPKPNLPPLQKNTPSTTTKSYYSSGGIINAGGGGGGNSSSAINVEKLANESRMLK